MSATETEHQEAPSTSSLPAESTRRAVTTYRDLHSISDREFPQIQGLLAADVVVALDDPRTISAPVWAETAQDFSRIPVLTPIDLVSWYSPEFRSARFPGDVAADVPMWHLSSFPAASDAVFDDLLGEAFESLHQRNERAVVFVDHADCPEDPSGERLAGAIRRAAPSAIEVPLGPDGGGAHEHFFAGRLEFTSRGRRLHDIDLRTTVTGPTQTSAFVDELWAIYEEPFRELAALSPLRPYFTRAELADVLAQPGVLQTCHRPNDRLVSWAMWTSHLESFPWLNPAAFLEFDPDIDPRHVQIFPGLVTDRHYRGNSCAELMIKEGAYVLARQSAEHTMVFETLDENAGFLPGLIEDVVEASGYGRVKFETVGVQTFRAWRI